MTSFTCSFVLLIAIAATFALLSTCGASAALTAEDSCEEQYFLTTSSSPSTIFTVEQINAALKALNDRRRNISVDFPNHKPSKSTRGMPMVKWNQTIADHAYNYQKDCVGLTHSSSTYRNSLAGGYLGENLYVSSGGSAASLKNAFLAWGAEVSYYTYGCGLSSCNGGVVGHYTQDMWAETTQVGCAYVNCASGWKTQINCQYHKGGNIGSQRPWAVAANSSDIADCQRNGGALPPSPSTGSSGAVQFVFLCLSLIFSSMLI